MCNTRFFCIHYFFCILNNNHFHYCYQGINSCIYVIVFALFRNDSICYTGFEIILFLCVTTHVKGVFIMEDKKYEGHLLSKPDDKLPIMESLLLGLQHLLAMDIYVAPFIIATILSLSLADSAFLIQATFIGAGIATLIQSKLCMRLPIAQGPSYVPIGAIAGIALGAGGGIAGMANVYGAFIVGSLVVIALGFTKVLRKAINYFVPPLVGGTIIFVVGLSLMPVAISENIFALHGSGTLTQNIILAVVSAAIVTLCVILGIRMGTHGKWLRIGSVILSLIIGTIVASFMGRFSLEAVNAAPWFAMPRFAFVDFPVAFDGAAIATMLIIYMILMAETTGTWFAVSSVIEEKLTPQQLDRGIIGEGLGCFFGALFGGTPVTGYSTNAGLISITGVASRHAFYSCGIWMVLFGLSNKLATLIASIPSPVIGGVFAIVCAIISLAGFRVIRHVELNERNMFVIGIPIIISMALFLMPKDYLYSLPPYLQYFLGSPLAGAAFMAVILNKVLPAE